MELPGNARQCEKQLVLLAGTGSAGKGQMNSTGSGKQGAHSQSRELVREARWQPDSERKVLYVGSQPLLT